MTGWKPIPRFFHSLRQDARLIVGTMPHEFKPATRRRTLPRPSRLGHRPNLFSKRTIRFIKEVHLGIAPRNALLEKPSVAPGADLLRRHHRLKRPCRRGAQSVRTLQRVECRGGFRMLGIQFENSRQQPFCQDPVAARTGQFRQVEMGLNVTGC